MQKITIEEIKEIFSRMMGDYIVFQSDGDAYQPILMTDGIPEMFGYTKTEWESILREQPLDAVWGVDSAELKNSIDGLIKQEKEITFTTQLEHKELGYTWVHTRVKTIGEMDDKITYIAEFISVDDIAKNVSKLTDQSSQILYVVSADTFKLLYVNDKYLEWTNLSKGGALSKACYDVCIHSERTGQPCKNCLALRAYANGGSIEVVQDDGKTYYNVHTKKMNWGGHEAYAVSVTDITETRLAEKSRLDAYNQRISTSIASISNSYLIYDANLTQNTVHAIHMPPGSSHVPSQGKYDDMFAWMSERISFEPSRINFCSRFSKEKLLETFYDGHMTVSISTVYTRAREDDTYLRITAYMRQNPVSKDVEATIQLEDVSSEHAKGLLAEYMIQHAFDNVAVLDLKYEKMAILEQDASKGQILQESLPYQTLMEQNIPNRILQEDQILFKRNSSLSNIREKLMQTDYYSFTAHTVGENGTVKLERFSYAYLNKYRQTVVATVEDVTEDFEIDDLTGLYNYTGFCIRAAQLIQNNTDKNYAILYFNIKGFKAVNELFGNEAGDRVLQEITKYLSNSSLQAELIGRIAVTDHFICLAEEKNVCFGEIKNLCHIHMMIDGKKVSIRGRCGIYMVTDRNMGVDRMCDQAKIAKQNVQDEFVKPYAVFDEKMKEAYLTKTNAVTVVNQALDNGEFCVYYQPIFDAKTGELASAEALVRWARPGIGVVSPGLFVPALEENGYISLVDRFVARTVRNFQESRIKANRFSVPISVNLSWIDFYDESMMKSVMEDIAELDSRKGMLRYEVTETSWAAMNSKSSVALREMRDKGVKILLDDFGSGFSSFSTIRDYDFDILKIDMGFVQKVGVDEKTDGIICAIIDMAHHIHATVVAEGVETDAQRKFLAENGCDYLQGYYFSKPIPEDEFLALLDKHDVEER